MSKGVTAFSIPTLDPTKDPNSAIYVVDQVCVRVGLCVCVCVCVCVGVCMCVCVCGVGV